MEVRALMTSLESRTAGDSRDCAAGTLHRDFVVCFATRHASCFALWLWQVTFNPRRVRRFASNATASATITKSCKAKVPALHALQALNGNPSCRACSHACSCHVACGGYG
jgi:hypothetical protein